LQIFLNPSKNSFSGKTTPYSCNRFHNDTGNLSRVLANKRFYAPEIIIGCRERMLCEILRNSKAVWNSKSCGSRARLYKEAVPMAMVAPFEFEDLVSSRIPPG